MQTTGQTLLDAVLVFFVQNNDCYRFTKSRVASCHCTASSRSTLDVNVIFLGLRINRFFFFTYLSNATTDSEFRILTFSFDSSDSNVTY